MSDPSHPLRALRPIVLRFLKPVHLCDRVAPAADAAHAGRPRIGRARPTGLQRPLLAAKLMYMYHRSPEVLLHTMRIQHVSHGTAR